jgi:multicomponent Na+:H+ antiporter subunit E
MLQPNQYFHIAGLVFTLTVLWLLLSGHYTPLMLSLGLLSIILVTLICLRMNIIVYEQPEILLQVIKYIPYTFWLVIEILKSNIDVIKRILNPKLPISPRWVTIQSSQNSDFSKVVYANSITLTPGTISMDVDGNNIDVHALSESGVDGLASGEMDQRVTRAEQHNV